jgi:hypothetical protein
MHDRVGTGDHRDEVARDHVGLPPRDRGGRFVVVDRRATRDAQDVVAGGRQLTDYCGPQVPRGSGDNNSHAFSYTSSGSP